MKSGPLLMRKQAINSLKQKPCHLLNKFPDNSMQAINLKDKRHKNVTIFTAFSERILQRGGKAAIHRTGKRHETQF